MDNLKILEANKAYYRTIYEYNMSSYSILVNRMLEQSDGKCLADITVERWTTPPQHVYHARGDIKSTSFKGNLFRALARKVAIPQWEAVVEETCMGALYHLRSYTVSSIIEDTPFASQDLWQLEPYIAYQQPSILFGWGSTGKTLLALVMAMSVQSGVPLLGMKPKQGNVLFCDWETSETVIASRLSGLKQGMGITMPMPIRYMFCFRPLFYSIPELAQEITKHQISTLIIDNFGAALGGEANDVNVGNLFNGLRELGCSVLLIDHRAKGSAEGRATPFGSVYKENRARIVWKAELSDHNQSGEFSVYTTCEKTNISSRYPANSYDVLWMKEQQGDVVKIEQRFSNPVARFIPIQERIENILSATPSSTEELSNRIGLAESDIENILLRNQILFVRIGKIWTLREEE